MKKTLSMIIAIAMIAAMIAPMGIFASATEVVEVSTWAEFVAQANANFGEGSYKLTADSTADTSLEDFFGTFDGDNHTITASTTLFEDICGPAVIKNFTVNPAKDAGGNEIVFTVNPVIHRVLGSSQEMPVWISGVTNNVSVGLLPEYELDGSSLQDPTGGIIGLTDSENWIYMYNVVNNGNMVSDDQTGGIIGNCGHTSGATYLTMVNVVNNGDVFAYNSYAGGIVGNVNAQLYGDFSYCINNGNVSSENNAGGIIGQVNGKSEVSFSYCANSGTIDQNPIITLSDGTERKLTGGDKTGAKYGAAGICPRFSNSDVVVTMDNCVIMGALDNDSTEDNTAYSSADPFNAWNKDNQAIITINDCYYLYGMNAVGEYAASLQNTGFFVLEESACKDAFDAIVADASKQPAPELDSPVSIPVDVINVLGYVAPTVGASLADALANLSVPADAPYSIIDAYWFNDTLDDYESGETFVAGYSYSLGVEIKFADGYVLADEYTVQFNGDASLCDPLYILEGNENTDYDLRFFSVSTTIPAEGGDTPTEPTEKIEIDSVDISGITAPTHGQTVGDYKASFVPVLPDGANYSIISIEWAELNPETMTPTTGEPLADDYVFDSAKLYAIVFTVVPAEGYAFAEDAVLTANGGNAEICKSVVSSDFAGIAVTLTPDEGGDEPIVIDTINVNGYVAPTAGANIADNLAGLSVPADAPYSIVNAHWYNDTLDDIAYEETFVAGYSYSLCVEIKLADGYVLAAEWTEQLNGNAALVDSQYSGSGNEETDYDLYYYSIITDLEGELSEIDTINVNGYVAPTVGADIAASLAGLSVPEGVNYSITNAYWYNVTIDDYLTEGTFEAGNSYRLNVEITSPLGYVFATDLNAQFNGDAALVDTDMIYTYLQGVDYYSVATTLSAEGGDTPIEPTEKIEIDSVDVSGITAPTHGQSVGDYKASLTLVLPEGANYSVRSITITEINPETLEVIDMLADGDVFDSSKTYSVGILVEAGDGYVFATDAVLTANGGEEELINTMIAGDEAGVAVAFTPAEGGDEPTEPTVIDTINVNGYVAPTAGANIADNLAGLSVPADAPYSIVNAHWYNDTLDDIAYEETFVAGYSYSLCVEIKLADGYVLAAEWTEQLNGNATLVDSQYSGSGNEETDYDLYYYSIITELPSEGGDEPTEKIEIDSADISGITAPEYGKTVADYKASFVPVLPEGANYTFVIMAWVELDPETMTPVSTEVLADDHVFDASKTYSALIGIQANDGYVFADDAVITVNGGEIEVFESIAMEDKAIIGLVFNPTPETGDSSTIAVFAIVALASIGCVALTLRKKED